MCISAAFFKMCLCFYRYYNKCHPSWVVAEIFVQMIFLFGESCLLCAKTRKDFCKQQNFVFLKRLFESFLQIHMYKMYEIYTNAKLASNSILGLV